MRKELLAALPYVLLFGAIAVGLALVTQAVVCARYPLVCAPQEPQP